MTSHERFSFFLLLLLFYMQTYLAGYVHTVNQLKKNILNALTKKKEQQNGYHLQKKN